MKTKDLNISTKELAKRVPHKLEIRLKRLEKFIARLRRDTEGQDLVEYVLLIALIALAVATAFPPVVTAITNVFTAAAGALTTP